MHPCLTRLKRGDVIFYRMNYSLDHTCFKLRFRRYNTHNPSLIVEDTDDEENYNLDRLQVHKIVKAK